MNIPRLVATQPQVPLASNISLDGDFIQLRGVRKAYGEQLVVMDDMNLDMRADDRLVIIGPSGSGKSSLLRVLMGLEGIQGGTISFQGKPYINGERRTASRWTNPCVRRSAWSSSTTPCSRIYRCWAT